MCRAFRKTPMSSCKIRRLDENWGGKMAIPTEYRNANETPHHGDFRRVNNVVLLFLLLLLSRRNDNDNKIHAYARYTYLNRNIIRSYF